MWRFKDLFINLYLIVRLFLFVKLKSKKLKNVNNNINKDGWKLTFNDEFNGPELDRSVWRTDAYFGLRFHPGSIFEDGITPPNMYYDDEYNVIENNTLIQLASNIPTTINYTDWDGINWGEFTIPYKIGQIDSSKGFKQKYGYWEIRSKITDQPGSWPAFWLVSTDNYPPEIDIYEIYTGRKNGLKSFSSNFHWRKEKGDRTGKKIMRPRKHVVLDVSENFHTYALEWNKKHFKIYYDNVLVRIYSNPETLRFLEYKMHIIIGNGIHTEQNPEGAIYPTKHEVDYVRVYKKKK